MAISALSARLNIAWRYGLLIAVALVFLFPVVFMVMSSFKPDQQLLSDSGSVRAFLPVGDLSLQNYIGAFERVPVALFVFNSVFVTAVTVILSLLVCSLAGFSLTFLSWVGRDTVLAVIIATLIVPFETIAIPLLLMVAKLPWLSTHGVEVGWLNTYHVQIIPWVADGLTVFLFVQYFRDLPRDLLEAARIDGASWWQVYSMVIIPLSGPVLATAAILKCLAMYNQYLWPLMVTQAEAYRPLMVGLQYFFQLNIAWGQVMAYLCIVSVPIIVLYLVLQRAFITSIASTGIKG